MCECFCKSCWACLVSKAYLPFCSVLAAQGNIKRLKSIHVPKYLAGHFCEKRSESKIYTDGELQPYHLQYLKCSSHFFCCRIADQSGWGRYSLKLMSFIFKCQGNVTFDVYILPYCVITPTFFNISLTWGIRLFGELTVNMEREDLFRNADTQKDGCSSIFSLLTPMDTSITADYVQTFLFCFFLLFPFCLEQHTNSKPVPWATSSFPAFFFNIIWFDNSILGSFSALHSSKMS